MADRISDPSLEINNVAIGVIPNSVEMDEGLGEQSVESVSYGNGNTDQIYSDNVSEAFGMVKMAIPPTVQNIALVRSWKLNRNQNTIRLTGTSSDGQITRVFKRASLPAKYTVPLSGDKNIELEFTTDRAV